MKGYERKNAFCLILFPTYSFLFYIHLLAVLVIAYVWYNSGFIETLEGFGMPEMMEIEASSENCGI